MFGAALVMNNQDKQNRDSRPLDVPRLVLFGLATLQLPGVFGTPTPVVFGVWVFGPTLAVLTWLAGLAVVWLLWRPASSAFFKPRGFTQAGSGAAISSRIRSSSARPPRQW